MRSLPSTMAAALAVTSMTVATLFLGDISADAARHVPGSSSARSMVRTAPMGMKPVVSKPAAQKPIVKRSVVKRTTTPASGRIPVTKLRVMSYTPADSPWIKMWNDFPRSRIDADFAQIAGLGANTVRIAIAPWGVGFPKVTTVGAGKVRTIVDLAKKHGLALQFTLFDWSAPFTDEAGSLQWMTQLLTPYKNDRSIALVEVKNEVDVDQPTVLPWARTMLQALPSILPGVPRTISVGGSQTLALP